jgi:hypothetical protein
MKGKVGRQAIEGAGATGAGRDVAPNGPVLPPPAAPVRDGRIEVQRRIEALTVQDIIANKAARKALVGLARMILATYGEADKAAKRAMSLPG